MTDVPVWEAIPFTHQRYQALLQIEKGLLWWDDEWKTKRVTGTPRGSTKAPQNMDFAESLGLAYRTQQTNRLGWFQYGLTTDGQILIERWKKGQR